MRSGQLIGCILVLWAVGLVTPTEDEQEVIRPGSTAAWLLHMPDASKAASAQNTISKPMTWIFLA